MEVLMMITTRTRLNETRERCSLRVMFDFNVATIPSTCRMPRIIEAEVLCRGPRLRFIARQRNRRHGTDSSTTLGER